MSHSFTDNLITYTTQYSCKNYSLFATQYYKKTLISTEPFHQTMASNGLLNGLKLYGSWASPYTHRVQLALKLKGLEFEYIEEDLTNKSSSLLLHNPIYKKVPVLLHGDHSIVESVIILQYIDETWTDNSLLPSDPYERALVRFWCYFIDDKVCIYNNHNGLLLLYNLLFLH